MHVDGTRNTASKEKSALRYLQHLGPCASAEKPAEQTNSTEAVLLPVTWHMHVHHHAFRHPVSAIS